MTSRNPVLRSVFPLLGVAATLLAASSCSQRFGINSFFAPQKATSLPLDFSTTFISDSVWLATLDRGETASASSIRNIYVYRVRLNEAEGYPTKKWSVQPGGDGGTRTYFSEIGLLMARPGALYRVDENTPTDAPLSPIWKTPVSALGRSCVTSFKIDGKAYVGFAWNKAGPRRMFTRFPIDPGKPQKLDVAAALTQEIPEAPGQWGYGCFTDQKNERLWSNQYAKSPTQAGNVTLISGVNLRTLADAPVSSAPNYGTKNATLGVADSDLLEKTPCVAPSPLPSPAPSPIPTEWTQQNDIYQTCIRSNPYAISGDARGNILAGGAISYVHEAKNDLVFWRDRTSPYLHAAKAACFSSGSLNCATGTANHGAYSGTSVGPLASLQDGRIIGLHRLTSATPIMKSRVYLISPVDPDNLKEGIDVKLVKEVDGDAYMYNDFTGSTLYPREASLVVDFGAIPEYQPERRISRISVIWSELGGGTQPWRGFTLQARCLEDGGVAPSFETLPQVSASEEETPIPVASCLGPKAKKLELKASPDAGASGYSRVAKVKVVLTLDQ
ncbi:MAG: hypothetical protein NDJ89_08595 [Oligoflexia bacterium]|nr:hypothetical protein [Oligoflexia bacterium]